MVGVQVLASWLTPTSFFVLLNIVLATIFLNHNSKNNHHNQHHDTSTSTSISTSTSTSTSTATTTAYSQPHPQLIRAPSLFSRVASFNFSHYYHSEYSHVADTASATADMVAPAPLVETITRAPSLLFRAASFKLGWTSSPPPQQLQVVKVNGDKGKLVNAHEEAREGQMVNQNEVVSDSHVRREKVQQEEVKFKEVKKKKKVVRKKEKVIADVAKVEKKTTAFRKEDEEVDSKADDFINKFKQQLKMQRLESLLRYCNNTDVTA